MRSRYGKFEDFDLATVTISGSQIWRNDGGNMFSSKDEIIARTNAYFQNLVKILLFKRNSEIGERLDGVIDTRLYKAI